MALPETTATKLDQFPVERHGHPGVLVALLCFLGAPVAREGVSDRRSSPPCLPPRGSLPYLPTPQGRWISYPLGCSEYPMSFAGALSPQRATLEAICLDLCVNLALHGFPTVTPSGILGDDRAGVERLLRYCARPPFALERLHALGGSASLASPEARLLYRFPRPTPDGRTQILLSPLQLLERIARFVPPPRMHRHRYHGVLAPNARARSAVVAIGRSQAESPQPVHPALSQSFSALPEPEPARPSSPARIRWSVLLARIYEVLPLLCPACGGQMAILAFLTDPPVVSAILLYLDLPHRPPPLSTARGPPQGDFLLDQTPAFDPADPEPAPEFSFDQSLPPGFDD